MRSSAATQTPSPRPASSKPPQAKAAVKSNFLLFFSFCGEKKKTHKNKRRQSCLTRKGWRSGERRSRSKHGFVSSLWGGRRNNKKIRLHVHGPKGGSFFRSVGEERRRRSNEQKERENEGRGMFWQAESPFRRSARRAGSCFFFLGKWGPGALFFFFWYIYKKVRVCVCVFLVVGFV
ncbi:hypothetical protein GGI42DRAFT_165856 [Trichoderma sp. SZMC 28013]